MVFANIPRHANMKRTRSIFAYICFEANKKKVANKRIKKIVNTAHPSAKCITYVMHLLAKHPDDAVLKYQGDGTLFRHADQVYPTSFYQGDGIF